jgi:hypothetical protein
MHPPACSGPQGYMDALRSAPETTPPPPRQLPSPTPLLVHREVAWLYAGSALLLGALAEAPPDLQAVAAGPARLLALSTDMIVSALGAAALVGVLGLAEQQAEGFRRAWRHARGLLRC